VTFRIVGGESGELIVREWGNARSNKPPAVFLHPLNMQALVWRRLVAHLDPDRRYVAMDLRGHGTSTEAGPFGLQHWAKDCLSVLDASGIARAHLVGGSMGGVLAAYVGVAFADRVISTTSLGSGLPAADAPAPAAIGDLETLRARGARAWFREIVPGVSLSPSAPAELVHEALLLSNANTPATILAVLEGRLGDSGRAMIASGPTAPALVLVGEDDPARAAGGPSALASALGADLIVLAGSGHLPMLEVPQAVAEHIDAHLTTHDPADISGGTS
jgi:3-oxoadipate enol-lactonase